MFYLVICRYLETWPFVLSKMNFRAMYAGLQCIRFCCNLPLSLKGHYRDELPRGKFGVPKMMLRFYGELG